LLPIAAFASMVTTIGRPSDSHASPKSANISGGIGLPPIVNDFRASLSESPANATAADLQ